MKYHYIYVAYHCYNINPTKEKYTELFKKNKWYQIKNIWFHYFVSNYKILMKTCIWWMVVNVGARNRFRDVSLFVFFVKPIFFLYSTHSEIKVIINSKLSNQGYHKKD